MKYEDDTFIRSLLKTRLVRTVVASVAFVTSACADTTAPRNDGLLGCHALVTSALSNGSPAASATLRFTQDSVERLQASNGTPTSGLSRGIWKLDDDGETLRMWFGGGFVGVTYTFTARVRERWFGTVLFWVDTPTLNGDGSAVLSPIACP